MEIDEIYKDITGMDDQYRAIEAAKRWCSTKFKEASSVVASLVLIMSVFCSHPALAFWGADTAVLSQILAQAVAQVQVLTDQLQTVKNHHNRFMDIYEGNKRLIQDIKGKVDELKKKAHGIDGWQEKIKNVEDVLLIVDEIAQREKSLSGVVVGEAKNLTSSMDLQKKLFIEAEDLRAYAEATDDPETLQKAGVRELTAHMAITQTQILKALNNNSDGSRESLAFQKREESEKIARSASYENIDGALNRFIGVGKDASKAKERKRPY